MRCMCCALRRVEPTTRLRKRWLASRCRQVLPVQRLEQPAQMLAWQRQVPPVSPQQAWLLLQSG
ncbi:hypothetical protein ALP20_200199 [Pseudomonas coronafaciens pv. coronafaciens]|nr:hypothetical protein ALP20_200199 [Pseudomonas coronafaciens pv. coronafaciens]